MHNRALTHKDFVLESKVFATLVQKMLRGREKRQVNHQLQQVHFRSFLTKLIK
jgi:hypothetical protein